MGLGRLDTIMYICIMEQKFIRSTEIVKGLDKRVSKGETNDCVVMSFASAFDLEYDVAHTIVKDQMMRKPRKGVSRFPQHMERLEKLNYHFNGKKLLSVKRDGLFMTWYKWVKGVKTLKYTTINGFVKSFGEGTYIVMRKGHAFVVKDGVIIGNPSDATQKRARIFMAWKVVPGNS